MQQETKQYLEGLPEFTDVCLAGVGGMGMVFRARDTESGRLVAIKTLTGEAARDGSALARFKREMAVLARIDHPHLVTYYRHCSEGPIPYFVMEYVEGLGWLDYCKQHSLGPREMVEHLLPVLAAVELLHQQKIYHRDIKPGNILVDQTGHAILVDLGLVTIDRETATKISRTGEFVGTPGFLAPETIHGETHRAVSDVYQLGMVLYRSITGRLPAPYQHYLAYLDGSRKMTAPAKIVKDLDPCLSAIIERAMAHDRRERYQSVRQLMTALEGWLAGDTVFVPPVNRPRQGRVRRLLPLVCVFALVFLLVGHYWQSFKGTATRKPCTVTALRLEELDRLVVRLSSAGSGTLRLGFRDNAFPPQLRHHTMTFQQDAGVRRNNIALSVDLPFAITEPTVVTATVSGSPSVKGTLEPQQLLAKRFAALDRLSAEAFAQALRDYDGLATKGTLTDRSVPELFTARELPIVRRLLPKLLAGSLLSHPLAKRLERLRYFESLTLRPPPWGPLTTVMGCQYLPARTSFSIPGLECIADTSLLSRVDGKIMWTWLGDRIVKLRSKGLGTGGLMYMAAAIGMDDIKDFDPSTEAAPMPTSIRDQCTVPLELGRRRFSRFPPRQAVLVIDLRSWDRHAMVQLSVNGSQPVLVPNAALWAGDGKISDPLEKMTLVVPIDGRWLRKARNRCTIQMKAFPGLRPRYFLSLSRCRLYVG